MGPPDKPPIGLVVTRTAKALNRAFERALGGAGGSQPVWLILLALKSQPGSTQRRLAEELGIREATMTHHLNGMEQAGLVTRRRDPNNRRVHQVTVTEDGEILFERLRAAALAFDLRLRSGASDGQLDQLTETLQRLADNASP
ncbi:MAG TPA: MarR family winged helix-turn-helix transcriptional regulator [Mycobacteriales bacterium]|nr:MarR family winged helix-turn-helix transcriptional regulator [Mycobacteriales bacterium]